MRAGPYDEVEAPRPAPLAVVRSAVISPAQMRTYALQFADGVEAAEFIVALRNAVADATTLPDGAAVRAWIDAPLRARGNELCCVYLTEACLDAAYDAGLDVPHSEPVDDPTFPEGRILVIEAPARR